MGQDLNLRTLGYEPSEGTRLLYPAVGQGIIEIPRASLKDWFLPLELLTRFVFTSKESNLSSSFKGRCAIRYTNDHL